MDKNSITSRLLEIVKHRKTPVVVSKQNSSYVRSKRTGGSLSSSGYSEEPEE